ncbi:alpha/beta-hydrolase [Trametes versicolor FP-101664 SS1]|uniref:alpha/beta-hydrolase n=1 Tax=Trametes versicolor (strain FP-101664) TaxID=717944 RepID=UPI000462361D|nr:alpha/beta-hydrolase [Trametes versicolor FP-101664 SS1]EIW55290.1 alpha/beta-hydrolase [Trametes versicolor FP-101664 SS1]
MRSFIASALLGVLAVTAHALPSTTSVQTTASSCREVTIPVTVSVPRFIINTTIADDWDAVTLALNLTQRDVNTTADPLPISGKTSGPVNSTYRIGATVCGSGGPTLILTHGIIESKLYWRPNFPGALKYSFVDAAVAQGYSVLSYDRIGVATSGIVDPLNDAQFQVESAVLSALTQYARKTMNATQVALIGHSYGSYISVAAASDVQASGAIDAVVLTGFSGTVQYFAPFVAGAALRVARTLNPLRWGRLASSYLTSADRFALAYVYFAGNFSRAVADWTFAVEAEPFALGELPSLLDTQIAFDHVTAPVLVLQGRHDVSACGGDCVGLLDATAALFTGSKGVQTVDNLPAGHDLFLHEVAPQAFKIVFDFLKAQGV